MNKQATIARVMNEHRSVTFTNLPGFMHVRCRCGHHINQRTERWGYLIIEERAAHTLHVARELRRALRWRWLPRFDKAGDGE